MTEVKLTDDEIVAVAKAIDKIDRILRQNMTPGHKVGKIGAVLAEVPLTVFVLAKRVK